MTVEGWRTSDKICGRVVCRLSSGIRLADHIGQQAEKTRALDRPRELALLLGRNRGDAAWHDLATLGDVALQQLHVLVVDLRGIGARERASLAPAEERSTGLHRWKRH